ncbi:autophagy protein 16-domain-containing protein [Naematelia encephala]|uniref:Autophagy protein 16-domain-containing protein n=1 Tax=Naematelia encephala TaxID=71784 RepID=A0A1Y2AS90_9TREE|nr:autophagy protein 16-domain-containing protein [Naematelia encephala]
MSTLITTQGQAGPSNSHPEWQNVIKSRMMAQQAEGEVYREIIDQYRRLAKTARELRIRNRALLRSGAGSSNAPDGQPSPLLAHLDKQLSEHRAEISQLYRTQAAAQNKQLALSDALRDRDDEVRGLREEVRELREARDKALSRERDWEERWRVRGKDMEALNDELLSLNLELTALSQRNSALQGDNAALLQRWLDKMNLTAEEMNDEFEKEAKESKKGKEKELLGTEGEKEDFRDGGNA